MYFLGILESVGNVLGVVMDAIRTLFYAIDALIYNMIIYAYNIFEILCYGKLLDNEAFNGVATRVGTILGVVMLFIVSFSVIQLLVNPDAISDSEKGINSIVKKVIITIVMLGVSGYVFNLLMDIQIAVISNDVIPKLILPGEVGDDNTNMGSVLAGELFSAFYQPNVILESDSNECGSQNYSDLVKEEIKTYGSFTSVAYCLTNKTGGILSHFPILGSLLAWATDEENSYTMDYNFLFCTIVGGIVLWIIFSYTISVGVRMVQLAALQVISPMAIIANLSPKKDNMFSKWSKIYISTYIDVFIRIAIIDFAIYLIAVIMNGFHSGSTFWNLISANDNIGTGTKLYIEIVMILAILQFAKKAPDLIKKLLPAGESGLGFGVGGEGALAGIGALAGFGVGVAGRVPGMIGNVNDAKGLGGKAWALAAGLGGVGLGAVTGIARGGKAGFGSKGLGSAIAGGGSVQGKANMARAQRISSGVGLGRYYKNKALNALGIENGDDRMDSQLKKYNEIISFHKEAKSEAESEIQKNGAHYTDGWNTLSELNVMRNDQNLSVADRVDAEDRYNKLLKAATNYTFDTGNIVTEGHIEFNNTTGQTDTSYIRATETNSTVSSRIGALGGSAAAAKAQKDDAQDKINEIQTSEKYRNRISGQK